MPCGTRFNPGLEWVPGAALKNCWLVMTLLAIVGFEVQSFTCTSKTCLYDGSLLQFVSPQFADLATGPAHEEIVSFLLISDLLVSAGANFLRSSIRKPELEPWQRTLLLPETGRRSGYKWI